MPYILKKKNIFSSFRMEDTLHILKVFQVQTFQFDECVKYFPELCFLASISLHNFILSMESLKNQLKLKLKRFNSLLKIYFHFLFGSLKS